jgi:hypothetical protein
MMTMMTKSLQCTEDTNPTNSTQARTTGCITLNPSQSTTGGYNFMSLGSGLCLQRQQWTSLLMSKWVIEYVEHMVEVEHQRELFNGEPLCERRHDVDEDPYEVEMELNILDCMHHLNDNADDNPIHDNGDMEDPQNDVNDVDSVNSDDSDNLNGDLSITESDGSNYDLSDA